MRDWCRSRRGSIGLVASMTVQHDGTVGVNHSAVSRTLAGLERNALVIAALRKLIATASPKKARSARTSART